MIQQVYQNSEVNLPYIKFINNLLCTSKLHCAEVKQIAKGPVLIGSGVSISNIGNYLSSDAVIVGSHFKVDGKWQNPIDNDKVFNFTRVLQKLQNTK